MLLADFAFVVRVVQRDAAAQQKNSAITNAPTKSRRGMQPDRLAHVATE
jgi:hypothetical protein